MTALIIAWRLAGGVRLSDGSDAVMVAVDDAPPRRLVPTSPPVRAAFWRLIEGCDDRALVDGLDERSAGLVLVLRQRMAGAGMLVAEMWQGGTLLATLLPLSATFDPATLALGATTDPLRLSRFALMRREGESLVLEAADAPCRVRIEHAQLHTALATAARTAVASDPALRLLAACGFLVSDRVAETQAQQMWEPHDRLMHWRTRDAGALEPTGTKWPWRGRVPAPPAIRLPHPGTTVALPAPPPPAETQGLHALMERRRTNREMAKRPVTLTEVATLLHRVARVQRVLPRDGLECLQRPFPSGGAIHELEFYLAVYACDGLDPGFYHYRGDVHALTRLAAGDVSAREIVKDCARAWRTLHRPPHVVVVLATRLPRLAWKYQGIAYRLSLLNAGVALQALQLVAVDMGLAGSPAGTSRAALFAAATGLSSWEETSIAEFGFGRAAEADAVR